MTATETRPQAAVDRSDVPIPFTRLVGVELRKTVDTRAARTLLSVFVALGLLVFVAALSQESRPGLGTISATGLLAALAMPLLGVLSMTSEWSQRTALSTFVLVPRRMRVLVAKVAAAALLAVALMTTLLAVCVLVLAAVAAARGTGLGTDGVGPLLVGTYVPAVAGVLLGVAWGALLLSTPLAIVIVLLAPLLVEVVLVATLGTTASWFGSSTVLSWASGELAFSPAVLSSALLWYVAPLVGGLVRQVRRDIH